MFGESIMLLEGSTRSDTTALLLAADSDGGTDRLDRLLPVIYDELRALAHRQLAREQPGHTLHTTALVHEAYLRLVDQTRVTERGRAYFFGAAAQAMRRVLIEHARKRRAVKRGGGEPAMPLDEHQIAVDTFATHLIDLDDALDRLAQLNPRQARVVECRFFGGLKTDEIATAMGVSPRTVRNDWTLARAWLYRSLYGDEPPEG